MNATQMRLKNKIVKLGIDHDEEPAEVLDFVLSCLPATVLDMVHQDYKDYFAQLEEDAIERERPYLEDIHGD